MPEFTNSKLLGLSHAINTKSRLNQTSSRILPRIDESSPFVHVGNRDSRLIIPPRPNFLTDLDTYQVDHLLSRVNMDSTFLGMATSDLQLINSLKQTITYQQGVLAKREKLVLAIANNVQYLSALHKQNSAELKSIREKLQVTEEKNHELEEENRALVAERNELRQYKTDLEAAQKELNAMLVNSQANAEEIARLHNENGAHESEMEQLKLETTVVVTEKMALKKELDRIDELYNKLQKDFREQRIQFDLMVDEISKANKQNSEYRGLILENESKL